MRNDFCKWDDQSQKRMDAGRGDVADSTVWQCDGPKSILRDHNTTLSLPRVPPIQMHNILRLPGWDLKGRTHDTECRNVYLTDCYLSSKFRPYSTCCFRLDSVSSWLNVTETLCMTVLSYLQYQSPLHFAASRPVLILFAYQD